MKSFSKVFDGMAVPRNGEILFFPQRFLSMEKDKINEFSTFFSCKWDTEVYSLEKIWDYFSDMHLVNN